MKKQIIALLITLSIILSFGSMTVFATEVDATTKTKLTAEQKAERNEYNKKAQVLKDEIAALNAEMKTLRTENKQYREELKDVNKKYKAKEAIPTSLENYKKALELQKTIPSTKDKETTLDSETSVQSFVKNKDYEGALNKLTKNLEAKKVQLTNLKSINAIWKEIHELLK